MKELYPSTYGRLVEITNNRGQKRKPDFVDKYLQEVGQIVPIETGDDYVKFSPTKVGEDLVKSVGSE